MLVRVIVLPFVGVIALLFSFYALMWGSYLISLKPVSALLGLVCLFLGMVGVPTALFYGLAAFTADATPITRTRRGRLLWSFMAYFLAGLTVLAVSRVAEVPFWVAIAIPGAALVVGPRSFKAAAVGCVVFFCLLFLG